MHEETNDTIEIIGLDFILPNIGTCQTVIWGNEGPIPHFHILSKDRSFNLGINLLDATYCDHNKTNYILSDIQIKSLIDHLFHIDGVWSKCTNWCYLLIRYYENNELDYNLPKVDDFTSINLMPDYRNINDERSVKRNSERSN